LLEVLMAGTWSRCSVGGSAVKFVETYNELPQLRTKDGIIMEIMNRTEPRDVCKKGVIEVWGPPMMAVSRGKQRAHPAPPRVAAEVQALTEGGELEVLLCVVALVAVVMASPLFPTPELTWTKLFIFACGCVCVDACAAVLREVVGVDVYALVSSIPAHVLRMRCERDERGCARVFG